MHIGDGSTSGEIVLFKETTLQRCKSILEIQRCVKLKYNEVILSECINGSDGFHMECHKKSTALSEKQRERFKLDNETENKKRQSSTERLIRSEMTSPTPSSSRGLFPNVCIFCSKETFKYNQKRQQLISVETKSFELNIKEYATVLNDQEMLTKIRNIDFVSKEVKCHGLCRYRYQNRAENVQNNNNLRPNSVKSNSNQNSD